MSDDPEIPAEPEAQPEAQLEAPPQDDPRLAAVEALFRSEAAALLESEEIPQDQWQAIQARYLELAEGAQNPFAWMRSLQAAVSEHKSERAKPAPKDWVAASDAEVETEIDRRHAERMLREVRPRGAYRVAAKDWTAASDEEVHAELDRSRTARSMPSATDAEIDAAVQERERELADSLRPKARDVAEADHEEFLKLLNRNRDARYRRLAEGNIHPSRRR